MSTSKTITRTDLANILNEVLPPADYSKVVETQSFTALNKAWTFRRIGNIVFVDASADMSGSVPAGYSDIGTLNTSMCPKSNIYIQVGNATENAFLIVQPTGLVRFYHQTATSGAHNCGISGYGWIAGEGQLSPPPSPDCADYIVEQGTSGIWTYRKWNSGIAECWGIYTFDFTSMIAWANNIYYSQPYQDVYFPTSLFTASPVVEMSHHSNIEGWFSSTSVNKDYIDNLYLLRPGQASAGATSVSIAAKGEWK